MAEPGQHLLDSQASFEDVKTWLGSWMEGKTVSNVLAKFHSKGAEPSGQVLLSMTTFKDLVDLGLPQYLARKIHNKIRAEQQQGSASPASEPVSHDDASPASEEAGPSSLASKRTRQGASAPETQPAEIKRAKQQAASAMDVEIAPPVGADDDDDDVIEVVEIKKPNPVQPPPVQPTPATNKPKRGRPKKTVKLEAQTPATAIKADPDADCVAQLNLGTGGDVKSLLSPEVEPTPGPNSGRRSTRKAASAAMQLLQTVAKAERADLDDYRASTKLSALKGNQALKVKAEPGTEGEAGPSTAKRIKREAAAAAAADGAEGDDDGDDGQAGDDDMQQDDKAAVARAARVVVKKKEESEDEEMQDEDDDDPVSSDDGGGDNGSDSDYQPSPEPRERGYTDGRRRATGRVKQWEDSDVSDDSEVEVEVEEQAEDVFRLPMKPDQPLPGMQYKFSSIAAAAGFKAVLNGMDLQELSHMVQVLGLDAARFRTYQSRKVDKETGQVHWVTRKSPVSRWRKLMFDEYGPVGHRNPPDFHTFGDEAGTRRLIKQFADDAVGRDCLVRYLDSWFRVSPLLTADGSNLPDVVMKMWSVTAVDPAPDTCIFGTRVIHILKPKDRAGHKVDGTARLLLTYLNPPLDREHMRLKLDKEHHKTPGNDRKAVLAWLKVASLARSSTISAKYKIYHNRQTDEYTARVTVTLTRGEVLMGLPELEDEQGIDLPEDVPEEVAAAAGKKEMCDLLALFRGLDHVRGVEEHDERLDRAEFLRNLYQQVVTELEEANVQEWGQGAEKLLNVGQMEELLHYVEGQEYDLPDNIKRVLKRLKLKLLPAQVQSVAAIMQEERSCGSGRHLWTELPLPQQPKFDVEERRRQVAELERERREQEMDRRDQRAVRARERRQQQRPEESEDSDDDGSQFSVHDDESDGGPPSPDDSDEELEVHDTKEAAQTAIQRAQEKQERAAQRASQRASRHTRGAAGAGPSGAAESRIGGDGAAAGAHHHHQGHHHAGEAEGQGAHQGRDRTAAQQEKERQRQQKADERRRREELGDDSRFLDPVAEAEATAAVPGITPVLRCFYCPLLNALVWNTDLKEINKSARAALPLHRGIMCCLEVGMGKTAVALAAATQSRRGVFTHCERSVEEGEWDDKLLFDGYDGHRGHLFRGGTLVIAPKTLLPQWETIEITKFLGRSYREENVVNSSGAVGKRRPSTPEELAKFDIVLVNAEMLCQKANLPLYSGIIWERVVVDEAHQEPGLMKALAALPKRSTIMLTGTPVVQNADDIKEMMIALGLPAYSLLARSAYRMGYILSHYMIRYTFAGTQLTGEANHVLPAKTERVFEVAWNKDRLKYDMIEAHYSQQVQNYLCSIDGAKSAHVSATQAGHKPRAQLEKLANTPRNIQHQKVMECLRPMRHACAGGIPVPLAVTRPVYRQYNKLWYRDPDDEGQISDNDDEDDDEDHTTRNVKLVLNAKIQALMKAIKQLQRDEPDSKMVIFSSYNTTLDAIKFALEPEGFKYRTMDSRMSMKQRAAALDDFVNDPPTTIFLLSTSLASVGLTLVSANHMFLVEPNMNPAQELQAVGRIHRLGQTKPVTITRLIMQDSVESRIRKLMDSRRAAQRTKDFERAACGKAKTGKRFANAGDDVSGVCAMSSTEELLQLFG